MADLTATVQRYEALARDRILGEIYRSLYPQPAATEHNNAGRFELIFTKVDLWFGKPQERDPTIPCTT
ncbi:hypothetical protein M427DRAFT_57802 [Gonapodya prolifera JEL478]|uniref:Uncharacterized protein n=1 Tax=Gonapodya prolifera (strain JEL478) TaxID=1344416 RepID=A0A139AC36_GONPJ|nr:hypothetical protein M427DRAFT_57802 [Gonapodya prolifera JEL478]|eukprot:KXS14317.1 hypothetical protein M427DRAFT_57802 [Gonapodya prolifera JEL478]